MRKVMKNLIATDFPGIPNFVAQITSDRITNFFVHRLIPQFTHKVWRKDLADSEMIGDIVALIDKFQVKENLL